MVVFVSFRWVQPREGGEADVDDADDDDDDDDDDNDDDVKEVYEDSDNEVAGLCKCLLLVVE